MTQLYDMNKEHDTHETTDANDFMRCLFVKKIATVRWALSWVVDTPFSLPHDYGCCSDLTGHNDQ
jgi:hypothetical protein